MRGLDGGVVWQLDCNGRGICDTFGFVGIGREEMAGRAGVKDYWAMGKMHSRC